jgi:cell division protein FtsW (lipid II flippase)
MIGPFRSILGLFRGESRGSVRWAWQSSIKTFATFIGTLVVLGLLVLALAWWRASFVRLVQDESPKVRALESLTITLTENRPVIIGRDHLGQAYAPGRISAGSAAAPEHIELTLRVPDRADATKDRIELRNVASQRRLWLDFASGFRTFAERFEIPPSSVGDVRFRLPNASVVLRNVSSRGFDLWTTEVIGGRTVTKGPLLYRQRSAWREYVGLVTNEPPAGAADADVVAAQIGGDSTDEAARPMQVGLATAARWEQLRLVYRDDRLFLAPGGDLDRARYPIVMEVLRSGTQTVLQPRGNVRGFSDIRWTIAPAPPLRARSLSQQVWDNVFGTSGDPQLSQVLRGLVAGRTSYDVRFDARLPSAGREPIQRRLDLLPRRKVMFENIENCSEQPRPTECPVPIGELKRQGELDCAVADAFRQCWRTTSPLAEAGTSALMRGNPGGRLPFAMGPTATLFELALTKWSTAILALVIAVAFRVRGASDHLLDDIRSSGVMARLRSKRVRWIFVLLSFVLAMAPEISAIISTYTGGKIVPIGGFSPNAAMTMLVVNWGLAGFALVIFSPTCAISVGLTWLAVTIIAAIGSLTLAGLALDGPSSHWSSYFLKHKYGFLDVVPLIVTAIAVASRPRIRRMLRTVLLGSGFAAATARLIAPILLVFFFGLWVLIGSQTGIGGFQPIEAGKFAAIILIAATLVGLVHYTEDVKLRIGTGQRLFALLTFGCFAGLLFVAPVLRSDYSPVLIVLLLGATVGLIYTLFASVNVLLASLARREARKRIPLAFRPWVNRGVFRGPFWPIRWRGVLSFAGAPLRASLLLVLVVVTAFLSPTIIGWGVWFVLHVADWQSVPTDQRVSVIAKSMGQGRHVPAERFITWYDLDLDPKQGHVPRAQFRDLEFHVIRSRTEVAYAECAEAKSLLPASQGLERALVPVVKVGGQAISHVLDRPALLDQLCGTFDSRRSRSTDPEEVRAGGRQINDQIDRMEIPVAESDFAPAYMLARFGIGVGVMLYMAQCLLIFMSLYGLVRIHFGGTRSMLDAHLRQFVGVMLAGSITLYVLQWVLSWSNVLGLLPVMGQPMTWLSAGNSHHFFMALPCLISILLALRLAGTVPPQPQPRVPPSRLA